MICRVCQKEKPPEAFVNKRRSSSGKDTICKACAAARQKGYRQADRERSLATASRANTRYYERHRAYLQARGVAYRQDNQRALAAGERAIPDTKRCGRCQQELPAAEFSHASGVRDGLHSYCRACWRDYRQECKARAQARK